jgi:C1A family cysteine protease
MMSFFRNLEHVVRHNAENAAYKLEINEFADMSSEEFGKTHLGYQRRGLGAVVPSLGVHTYSGAELPASVDWVAAGSVTAPKNQGQCGSCWSFSTTGAIEGAWKAASGKLESLSEQQLIDCAGSYGNNGCGGGLMDNAFKYLEQAGLCSEASDPYQGKLATCGSCTVVVPKGAVTGYKDVASGDAKALMEALGKQPVAVAIQANQPSFQLYSNGVMTGTCGDQLDHGVLAVGYGELNGKQYWKVKNSWGASWGMDGYILLERGATGEANGKCGILSEPSFPVVGSGAILV